MAKRLARPGDLVLDFDDICLEIGGSHQWAHSAQTKTLAEAVMRERVSRVPQFPGTAYVIRTVPRPEQRMALAQYLDARVWVVNPGIAVCLHRAAGRPRGTARVIRQWYATYRPAPCDSEPYDGG